MASAINPELQVKANQYLDNLLRTFYDNAPAAKHLMASADVDKEMFKRHTIETILRIRLARVADSKVIHHFTKTDPHAAQKWSKYTEEEMLHDRLFLKDLKNLGMDEASVYGTDPLLATKLLQGYLYYTVEHEGPRGLLCKSYFVEYMTAKTQGQWNTNIKKSLGDKAVKGAEAHLSYDLEEDHSADVWNVLMAVVKSPEDEARIFYHFNVYFGLFVAYFNELALASQGDLAASARTATQSVILGAERAKETARATSV